MSGLSLWGHQFVKGVVPASRHRDGNFLLARKTGAIRKEPAKGVGKRWATSEDLCGSYPGVRAALSGSGTSQALAADVGKQVLRRSVVCGRKYCRACVHWLSVPRGPKARQVSAAAFGGGTCGISPL
jgi:hypothetical protein